MTLLCETRTELDLKLFIPGHAGKLYVWKINTTLTMTVKWPLTEDTSHPSASVSEHSG